VEENFTSRIRNNMRMGSPAFQWKRTCEKAKGLGAVPISAI
jgi:hypothetical protein